MNLLFDKIYVINLERRPDRLASVMNEIARVGIIGDIPIEIIPAVDGKKDVNEQFLAANNFKVYDQWTDPWWGRSISLGELGCGVTHYKLWQKIIENNETALILEDDVSLSDSFITDCQKITPQAENLDFEFVYLGRKPIYPEKEKRITSSLLIPEYSYWTCGYVLTPIGAKKLYEGGYNQNLIPVDEYIPYMYSSHNESINNLYNTPQNLKAFALLDDIVKPNDEAFLDSETEKSQPYQVLKKEDVKVFAFATEANDGLKMLYESSLKYGIPLEYTGLNEEWSSGNEARLDYPGGGQKVNILKNTIKDMEDDTLVVFTDGYDVIYNEGLNVIIEKFQKFNAKVVFGAETVCWPEENLKEAYAEVDSPLKYLNSGVIIGYVGELKRITNEDISNTDDDQLYYSIKYLSGDFDIKLDHKCEIIQNLSQFDQVQINKLNSNEWKQPFGDGNSSEKIVNDLIELSSTDTFSKHNRNDYAYDVSNAFKE